MPGEGVYAAAIARVPDLDGVVEGARDDALALRVEVQRHDLRRVAQQRVQALPGLHVPEACGVVHGPRGDHRAVGVERQTHDLRRMPAQRVVQLTRLRTPQLTRLVCVKKIYVTSLYKLKRAAYRMIL